LREKLTDPGSFWDVKETIDHLYDLIHVREEGGVGCQSSRPPDVTISSPGSAQLSNSTNSTTTENSGISQALPCTGPAFTSTPKTGPATATPPRYAQIRSKPKTAPICEYRDPSDSQMHIYSELSSGPKTSSTGTSMGGGGVMTRPRPNPTSPFICEYTEPKDVQTHVYAELNSLPPSVRPPLPPVSHKPGKSFSVQRQRPRPLVLGPPQNHTLNHSGSTTVQVPGLDSPCPNSPSCQQRPLPSIPAPFSN
jgi:hypothetical protein